MATAYRNNRSFYIDDETGMMWDSELKRVRFNIDTGEPMENTESKTVATTTVVEIIEEVENPLQCKTCGYISKSKAGLAVHSLKHGR